MQLESFKAQWRVGVLVGALARWAAGSSGPLEARDAAG